MRINVPLRLFAIRKGGPRTGIGVAMVDEESSVWLLVSCLLSYFFASSLLPDGLGDDRRGTPENLKAHQFPLSFGGNRKLAFHV
jgi:hypothetical protein